MKCPACTSTEQRVLSTRTGDSKITRLRCCDACGHRWNTVEVSTQNYRRLEAAAVAMRAFIGACKEIDDTEDKQV